MAKQQFGGTNIRSSTREARLDNIQLITKVAHKVKTQAENSARAVSRGRGK
jgi:hypothetical protein